MSAKNFIGLISNDKERKFILVNIFALKETLGCSPLRLSFEKTVTSYFRGK